MHSERSNHLCCLLWVAVRICDAVVDLRQTRGVGIANPRDLHGQREQFIPRERSVSVLLEWEPVSWPVLPVCCEKSVR